MTRVSLSCNLIPVHYREHEYGINVTFTLSLTTPLRKPLCEANAGVELNPAPSLLLFSEFFPPEPLGDFHRGSVPVRGDWE